MMGVVGTPINFLTAYSMTLERASAKAANSKDNFGKQRT